MPTFCRLLLALLAVLVPQSINAKQGGPSVRLEITSRAPAFAGHNFPAPGVYEQIIGKAHMRIDPLAPENRGIVDLDLAPRAADGMVEYDVDFLIHRPADPKRARRIMLYDVVNRGNRLMPMMAGGSMNPNDPGDGLLQEFGLTFVWSGWQGDIAGKSAIGARFPLASHGDKPVTGKVSAEAIFENLTSNTITLPYAAATLDQQESARLSVRQLSSDKPVYLPSNSWRFIGDRKIEFQRPGGIDAGAIYRFEYTARDPWVMGLGFAATRDLISWLRSAPASAGNPLGDIATSPCLQYDGCRASQTDIYSSAIAFGGSQSGRYLRDFLWQGFNRDSAGRRVFDGVIPFIPGGRRTYTNFRFAEPGRFSRQHEDHDVPGFDFPFAYATLRDPVTGRSDGILRRCAATGTCPKLFHIDTSAEFWQAGSSLVGTGGTARDVPFPPNVRAYMIAGGAHAPGMALPGCAYPANSLNYAPVVRKLILAMINWTTDGTPPPSSRWPNLAKGELVGIERLTGPAGFTWAKVANQPIPPEGRPAWPVHVPAIDADGNDIAGIRLPQIAAPEGTYLGWNLRRAGFGEGDLCLLAGSYLPFAKDAASRGNDPRPSLAERYPAPGARAWRFTQAVEELRRAGLLVEADGEKLVGTVTNDWLPNDARQFAALKNVSGGSVRPWDHGRICSWWLSNSEGNRHLASIGQGDGVVLSLSAPAFLSWPETGSPRVTLTFDQDPRRQVTLEGWVSKGGDDVAMLGTYLDAPARRAMSGARRLQLSRDGKPVLDLLLERTPTRAQLNACVPPPKGPNSDEE